jgi:hypothetical protein
MNDKMGREFQDFMFGPSVDVPAAASHALLQRIGSELNPSRLEVFKKLILIQFMTGTITLFFCPQMGIGFTSYTGLMNILMQFGEVYCMAGCGALFLGLSALLTALVLRPEELRVIKENQIVQFPVLALLTLGTFVCFGAPVLTTLGIAWLGGSLFGSFATFNIVQKIRYATL